MKKIFSSFSSHCLCMFLAVVAFSSCLNNGEDTIVLENGKATIAGIPSDADATPNPTIDGNTTSIPNVLYTIEYEGDDAIVRLDMTGIQDAEDESGWLRLLGTGFGGEQNIWVEVDGQPKGILVYNTADDQNNDAKVKADLVFLVDNSGSMGQEADAIARDIVSWSQKLNNSGLDMQYGCVGYDGSITGALNITDAESLAKYLNYGSGTSRTYHFEGTDATVLKEASQEYYNSYRECGVAALRFADEHFTFRTGANRIYVNFTDEPNQPGGKEDFSVEYVNNVEKWNTSKGTIHTVYSSSTNFKEIALQEEFPWKMSDYTGGTFLTASSSFTGVTLESLPVTGAMMNSYVIRFTDVADLMDGMPHEVKITILSPDGKTKAERTFDIIFG